MIHPALRTAIDAPPADPKSVQDCLQRTLQHEIDNSAAIDEIVNLAHEEKDRASFSFVQWFVKDQIEVETLINNLLDQYNLASDVQKHNANLYQLGSWSIFTQSGSRAFSRTASLPFYMRPRTPRVCSQFWHIVCLNGSFALMERTVSFNRLGNATRICNQTHSQFTGIHRMNRLTILTSTLAVASLLLAPIVSAQTPASALGTDAGKLDAKTTGSNVRASQLIGVDLQNAQGERVGEINDLVVDSKTGRVRYAAVTYGGFLGMGDKMFAVPFEAFKVQRDPNDPDDLVILLNVTKRQLEGAVGFDQDHWPNMADQKWARDLDTRYGVDRNRMRDRNRSTDVDVNVNRKSVDVDVNRKRD